VPFGCQNGGKMVNDDSFSTSQSRLPACKDPVAFSPILVVAPPKSSRSTGWTNTPIHRDYEEIGQSGVYSFHLFIDDVTEDNGAIRLWLGTTKLPLDPHSRNKSVSRMGVPEVLTGKKGCVWMCDSRLVHQSMPNKTGSARLSLNFLVASKKKCSTC